jgi:hypothetical protein
LIEYRQNRFRFSLLSFLVLLFLEHKNEKEENTAVNVIIIIEKHSRGGALFFLLALRKSKKSISLKKAKFSLSLF